MAAGALVVGWSALVVAGSPPGALAWVLAALTVLSAAATVRLPGFPVSFSLSDTFTIAAALLFGPATGALLVALDGLVISWRLSAANRTITRVMFNVMSPALAMWLGTAVLRRHPSRAAGVPTRSDSWLVAPLALFAAVYFVLNTGLVAAVAIGRSVPLARVWRQHFLPLGLTHFGGTALAGLLLLVIGSGLAGPAMVAIALPLFAVVLFAVLTGVTSLQGRSAQFAELRSYAAALKSTADGVLLSIPRPRHVHEPGGRAPHRMARRRGPWP
jgi:hypothetical protein